MTKYHVVWKIDVEADSPREAAQQAFEIQRDPDSTPLVFDVYDFENKRIEQVDLIILNVDGQPDFVDTEGEAFMADMRATVPAWRYDVDEMTVYEGERKVCTLHGGKADEYRDRDRILSTNPSPHDDDATK